MDPFSTLEPCFTVQPAAEPLWPGGEVASHLSGVEKILGDNASADARSKALSELGRRLNVLGVQISDLSCRDALTLLAAVLDHDAARARTLYFTNAHTLNLAFESQSYRGVLNRADYVFGDGTGVRWAARLQGLRLHDNLNGTDLIPALLESTAGRGFRLYLLGTTPDAISRAAKHARAAFPGWELAGYHHGFFDGRSETQVIADINRARPHLLLVAMGNPIQEYWIDRNRDLLQARLCVGVGALADRWAGDLVRAPLWVRRLGIEWIDILRRQPKKWRRYVLGNPQYLYRVLQHRRGHLPPVQEHEPAAWSDTSAASQASQPAQTAS